LLIGHDLRANAMRLPRVELLSIFAPAAWSASSRPDRTVRA